MKTTKLLLFILVLLNSCNKYNYDCLGANDRIITGYSKNMKRYKVINKYSNRECDVKIHDGDTLSVGDTLIIKDEFNLCF